MKQQNPKLKAIRNVKEKLSKVPVADVAKELKCTRQNIYFHLDESKAEKVNLDQLQKISLAIDKVAAAAQKKESKIIRSLI